MARTLTGNNRQREQRLQELMLLRMSQQFERRLAQEIARAMRSAARALTDGRVSPADQIREKHQQRIERLLTSIYRASMQAMAEHMTGTQRSWRGEIETKNLDEVEPTEVTDRLMQTWMATVGSSKITQITKTTQEDIRRVINRGIREGLSEREIGKLIRQQAPTKSASRAQTIARTEVHAASQASAQSVAEAANLNMVRVWVSSKGERTRTIADGAQFDHLAADGQRVGMNEPFFIEGINGDEELMYPGDPAGSAANIINCRCAVVFELA